MREGLDSPDLDSRAGGTLPLELHRALGAPGAQATVADLEFAHAVLVLDCEPVDDMPIVDLRIRKGVRRHGVKLAVATSRPSSLDPNAASSARFAPGAGEAFLLALSAALRPGQRAEADRLAQAAGADSDAVRALGAHAAGRRGRRRSSTASAWSRARAARRRPARCSTSPSA